MSNKREREAWKKRLLATYNEYGNVLISKNHYKHWNLDFGNHTVREFERTCWIVERA